MFKNWYFLVLTGFLLPIRVNVYWCFTIKTGKYMACLNHSSIIESNRVSPIASIESQLFRWAQAFNLLYHGLKWLSCTFCSCLVFETTRCQHVWFFNPILPLERVLAYSNSVWFYVDLRGIGSTVTFCRTLLRRTEVTTWYRHSTIAFTAAFYFIGAPRPNNWVSLLLLTAIRLRDELLQWKIMCTWKFSVWLGYAHIFFIIPKSDITLT